MSTFNIHEAKTNFSRLVDDAAAGAEVIIAKAGVPMVRLVPLVNSKPERRPGALKGLGFFVSDDFDAPLPDDIQAAFEGR